jgi:heat shock protein HtpX
MYDRIASNIRKTWALILVFIVFVAVIGWVFGYLTGFGFWGLGVALGIALLMTWGSYYSSDKLAIKMSRAVPADETQFRELHNIVEELCIAAGLPKPKVYIMNDQAPNAFATGRNPEHAAIAVTTGLLERMNRDELQGVIAHELSHVKNRDTLVSTLAVTLVGVIVLLADWMIRAMFWGGGRSRDNNAGGLGIVVAIVGLILLILSPIIAQLMQLAISRRREYLADIDGAFLTRHPDGLIHALEKLRDDPTVVRSASRATAHLWIESPIARVKSEGRGAWLNRLFDTHPPLDERIRILQEEAVGGELHNRLGAAPPAPTQ